MQGGTHYLATGRIEGQDPLELFLRMPPRTCGAPTDSTRRRHHGQQLLRPDLEQGCAFKELISFHGGLGGPQTRRFILYPAELPVPDQPIVGAAGVRALLTGWRSLVNGAPQIVGKPSMPGARQH